MKKSFYHADKTNFHKKGFTISLIANCLISLAESEGYKCSEMVYSTETKCLRITKANHCEKTLDADWKLWDKP